MIGLRKLKNSSRNLRYFSKFDLFNPTSEHKALREMVRAFTEAEVDPQAQEFNKKEKFNLPLYKKLGDLGLLGITVKPEYGGSGMDALAAVIVHEEVISQHAFSDQ